MHKPALLILLVLTVIAEIRLQQQQGRLIQQVLAAETVRSQEMVRLQNIKAYWQKIVSDFPTFRDGYVQLAAVESALGNKQQARSWQDKVTSVDPNWQPVPAQP